MFAFGPRNYRLMFIGLAFLAIGFFLMTTSKEPYGFGFVSMSLGPIVITIGFVIEFFAIMLRNKARDN